MKRSNLTELLNTTKTSVRDRWNNFRTHHTQSAAVAAGGVRASVAIAGLLLILASFGVAMGVSTPGEFRNSLVAMLPFSLEGDMPPAAIAGVIADGDTVPARELSLSSRAGGLVEEVVGRVGDFVEEGAVIVRIDDAEARRNVRDAEAELARAELALAQVGSEAASAPDDSSSRREAAASIPGLFDDAYIQMTEIYLTLPDLVSGLSGMLYGSGFSDDGVDYLMAHAQRISEDNEAIDDVSTRAGDRYLAAKEKYQRAADQYHRISSNSSDEEMWALLIQSQEAIGALSDATKAVNELFSFEQNHFRSLRYTEPPVFQEYTDALSNYSSQLTDQLALLNGSIEGIRMARAASEGGDAAQTRSSASDAERKAAELEVVRARNRLDDAKGTLSNYEVRAPFSGVIASIEKKKAQYVDDGEVVARLLARDTLVVVYLAQGQVVRTNVGQPALAAFEGTDIQLKGRVAEIGKGEKNTDGFVSFAVTVALDPDDRIHPGMRASVRFLED